MVRRFYHQRRDNAATVCYVKFDDDSEAGVVLVSYDDVERLALRITEPGELNAQQAWPVNSTIRIHPAGIYWE